jgi:hypothetical protein
MPFFGFIPSEQLKTTLETAQQNRNSKEPLYPLRDKTALLINDEIIDAIFTELVRRFPATDKRETAEKLAGYIKSTVAVLLKQLLGKASNDVVQQSIAFSERSTFKDAEGHYRIGTALDANLVSKLKQSFAEIKAGNDVDKAALGQLYKQFSDATAQHFMTDFNKTLDLGIIKRKASDLATIAVTKAVHIAIDKMFPNFTKEELQAIAEYHDTLFHS